MKHGILLLDKPQGISSSAAVQRVRRAFGRIKAGHTGSLDPLATGMLPICLGEATKVAGYLLEGDKQYEFTARFGIRTATGDLEGEPVEHSAIPADLAAALSAVLPQFLGPILQVPPMYSALKRDGQPLYRLARQGIEVERQARPVVIQALALQSVQGVEARLMVSCSKGTYVRTLAEDLARAVGSCAHLSSLRRTTVAGFATSAMMTLDALEADPESAVLLAPDLALAYMPTVALDSGQAARLRLGQSVRVLGSDLALGLGRIYGPEGQFLGIGRLDDMDAASKLLKPVRLFNDLDTNPT